MSEGKKCEKCGQPAVQVQWGSIIPSRHGRPPVPETWLCAECLNRVLEKLGIEIATQVQELAGPNVVVTIDSISDLYAWYKKEQQLRKSGKCRVCGRKDCICGTIKEMKRRGWRVFLENGAWRVEAPGNMRFLVGYAEEMYAWKFAVRRYRGEQRW